MKNQSPRAIDYQALADFRFEIRRFLNFSESLVRAAGIEPQQHQALLAIKGLPTHRVAANLRDFSWSAVRRYLEPWFATEVFPFTGEAQRTEAREKFLERLAAAKPQRAIGVYPAPENGGAAFYVLTLRPEADRAQILPGLSPLQRELDVVLLHQGILEPALGITAHAVASETNLSYEREASVAFDAVDRGSAQIVFLLNPVDVDLVVRVATAGEVMPQKSTDFYPKLLSGITMYRIEE